MRLERSEPVFRAWPKWYWFAGLALSFMLGMATANGFATRQALNAAWGSCHWQIREHMLQDAQRNKLQRQ